MHLHTPVKTTSCFSPLVSRFVFSVMNGGFHYILLRTYQRQGGGGVEAALRVLFSFLDKEEVTCPLKIGVSPHMPKLSFDLSTRGVRSFCATRLLLLMNINSMT